MSEMAKEPFIPSKYFHLLVHADIESVVFLGFIHHNTSSHSETYQDHYYNDNNIYDRLIMKLVWVDFSRSSPDCTFV